MPLPKAVQEIGDAAEAAATKAGMKPGSKPVVVETASSKLVPVKTTNEPAKVDPGDYQTRYSNYKKATDQTITDLRQTLATTQATLSETQRQVHELLTANSNSAAKPAEPVKSTAGTKDDPAYKLYLEKLPESIKNEYTEDYLFDQFIINSTAGAGSDQSDNDISKLETKLDNVIQDQNKTKKEIYYDEMDVAFPNDEWITLGNGSKWSEFCLKAVSPVDRRTFGDLVEDATNTLTSSTLIWVLNEYKQHLSTLDGVVENEVDPLLSQVTPEGAGGGGGDPVAEINARAETFTHSQVTQFFTDVATTKKYTAEEAGSIEKSILAAQAAGKIIPG